MFHFFVLKRVVSDIFQFYDHFNFKKYIGILVLSILIESTFIILNSNRFNDAEVVSGRTSRRTRLHFYSLVSILVDKNQPTNRYINPLAQSNSLLSQLKASWSLLRK